MGDKNAWDPLIPAPAYTVVDTGICHRLTNTGNARYQPQGEPAIDFNWIDQAVVFAFRTRDSTADSAPHLQQDEGGISRPPFSWWQFTLFGIYTASVPNVPWAPTTFIPNPGGRLTVATGSNRYDLDAEVVGLSSGTVRNVRHFPETGGGWPLFSVPRSEKLTGVAQIRLKDETGVDLFADDPTHSARFWQVVAQLGAAHQWSFGWLDSRQIDDSETATPVVTSTSDSIVDQEAAGWLDGETVEIRVPT